MNLIESIPNKIYYVIYSEAIGYFVPTKNKPQYVLYRNIQDLVGKLEEGVDSLEDIIKLRDGSFKDMSIVSIQDTGTKIEIRKVEN